MFWSNLHACDRDMAGVVMARVGPATMGKAGETLVVVAAATTATLKQLTLPAGHW